MSYGETRLREIWVKDALGRISHIAQSPFIKVVDEISRDLQPLTSTPAWISNHIPSKSRIELITYSQISKVAPLKFGNG